MGMYTDDLWQLFNIIKKTKLIQFSTSTKQFVVKTTFYKFSILKIQKIYCGSELNKINKIFCYKDIVNLKCFSPVLKPARSEKRSSQPQSLQNNGCSIYTQKSSLRLPYPRLFSQKIICKGSLKVEETTAIKLIKTYDKLQIYYQTFILHTYNIKANSNGQLGACTTAVH